MNTFIESIMGLARDSGFAALAVGDNWKCLIMIAISCVLLYLAIVKKIRTIAAVADCIRHAARQPSARRCDGLSAYCASNGRG